MKKILLPIIVLSFLIGSFGALAEENLPIVSGVELPNPGTLPDSSFYFLKSWKESIQTFFTFGAENKAKQYLHLAEVRLAEYQKMIEKGKTEIAEKTFEKYERQLDRALGKVDEARTKGKDVGNITEEIEEKRIKHMEILGRVSEKMPIETKQEIFDDRAQKWLDFISAVKEKYPGAISNPPEGKANLPAELILNCPVPKLPEEGTCRGEWLFQSGGNCPYFVCSDDGRMPVTEPPVHPTEIRYYTCPDGTKVESGKCSAGGQCAVIMGPEKQCPAQTPPVTPGTECSVYHEIKYYQCPDGTQKIWCWCSEEGNFAGAKNKWQCQPYPVGYTCQKTTVAPAPILTPTPTSALTVECKEPTARAGETRDYICPDGTRISPWCECSSSGIWNCDLQMWAIGWAVGSLKDPADAAVKICPAIGDTTPPTISNVKVLNTSPKLVSIICDTDEPAYTLLEYGLTTSYGSKSEPYTYLKITQQTPALTSLQPNTTYHFRVVAKDLKGNTSYSDDYTFTTGI